MAPDELKALIREEPATVNAAAILDAEIKTLIDELNPRLKRRGELTAKLAAIDKARADLKAAGAKPADDTQQAMPKVAPSRKQGEKK